MAARLRIFLSALLVAVLAVAGGIAPAVAQSSDVPAPTAMGSSAPVSSGVSPTTAAASIDYAAWDNAASDAMNVISAGHVSDRALDDLRSRMVDWRSRFDPARNANAAEIKTLKDQIDALGPAPTDGASEDPAIAGRRKDLTTALSAAQAPGLRAVEAFSRADGIIRQIDALVRMRQASAFIKLMPTPINPLHWPAAYAVLTQGLDRLVTEVKVASKNPIRQQELKNNLVIIIGFIVIAIFLMIRGAHFIERFVIWLNQRLTMRGRGVVATVVSLGEFVVPVLGTELLVAAVLYSGMTGPRLEALLRSFPFAAFAFFAARWLSGWLFPSDFEDIGVRRTERPREARLLTTAIGAVFAAEIIRRAFTTDVRPPLSQAAEAVWMTPLVVLVSILAYRLGSLIQRAPQLNQTGHDDDVQFHARIVGLSGTVMKIVSATSIPLALVGYVTAANVLIWPLMTSAALMGLIVLAQWALAEFYVMVTRSGPDGHEALLPVIGGFVLTILSLPVFALIWGARVSDLMEFWTQFQGGISIGTTTLSPGAVLTFFIVFGIGYMVTRLVQGAMRSSILPRTKLDKGTQNAAISGLGYIGIALSVLIAVTAAGINLSGLAIVAGALSVGIGFGLQNIVQNFVSGIILLIERPISEGDWIQVNGNEGIVKRIAVRTTMIETFDRSDVIIPNGDLVAGVVTNMTRANQMGRVTIPVGVAYGSDTRKVKAILQEIIEAQPLVMIDPPPSVVFVNLGASSLNFSVRGILADVNYKVVVQDEVLHQIVERFAAEGIEIPFPQQDVWVRGLPQRPAAADRGRNPAPVIEPTVPEVPATQISNDPDSDPEVTGKRE